MLHHLRRFYALVLYTLLLQRHLRSTLQLYSPQNSRFFPLPPTPQARPLLQLFDQASANVLLTTPSAASGGCPHGRTQTWGRSVPPGPPARWTPASRTCRRSWGSSPPSVPPSWTPCPCPSRRGTRGGRRRRYWGGTWGWSFCPWLSTSRGWGVPGRP